jgi:asparagine synthase (glutamine-hydrolysing)
VALTGQGADELFAGYSRYLRMSKTKLEAELLRDISNIGEANLQRDDSVSMANSIELRLPYMDSDVIGIALALPINLKINNGRRKYILKSIAKKMGLPEPIINKSKKAIQYSSGVEKAIRSLAKQEDNTIEDYLKSIYLERFQ